MRKTQLELDLLLIGPYGIDIISPLTGKDGSQIHPASERSWYIEEKGGVCHKQISPTIPLKRAETFVRSVLQKYGLAFPLRKVVLAPELYFGNALEPYQTIFVGKEKYNHWLQEKRWMKSPLKHDQLKVAEALLSHSRTISFKRPEWDMDNGVKED